jgi:hypothetical protein
MGNYTKVTARRTLCLGVWRTAVLLLLAPAWPRLGVANDGLAGRRFDTQAGMQGKAAHVPSDILSFAGGLFHSSDCDQYEYGKGRYTSSVEADGSIRFDAVTESPRYGRNEWKGRVRGRNIEGEFVFHRKPTWWRPNPDPLPHWFKGHEVDAAGKPLA